MITSTKHFVSLAILVGLWYLGLTYLPPVVGTCLSTGCGDDFGAVARSFVIPLAFFAVPILLETVVHRQSLGAALATLGLTRFSWTGIALAMVYLLPLVAFFPILSGLTGAAMTFRGNWPWQLLSATLNNGLAEETMMRGYVFRRLRVGRGFWRAATISTLYFAGYHVPLLLTAGPLVGGIAILMAIPIGLLTALLYERGHQSVWGPVLLHTVNNSLAFVVVFPANIQIVASSLYLGLGIVMATLMLGWAYRSGYGRRMVSTEPSPLPGNI